MSDLSSGKRHITLLCADCEIEHEEDKWKVLPARELGDGAVCLSCNCCGKDLAIIEVR